MSVSPSFLVTQTTGLPITENDLHYHNSRILPLLSVSISFHHLLQFSFSTSHHTISTKQFIMYSSLLTLALSFTALSSTLAASNVAPEIGKRDLHFGSSSDPVPGEILSSFESNDNEGANARRSPGLQFGGFEDLPTEVQDHITATRLAKRDSRKNCGPNRDGNVKTWVPVETWKENAQYFCSSFAQYGSALEIDDGKEPGKGWVWNSYDVALSQQDDAKYKRGVPGDPGRIACEY